MTNYYGRLSVFVAEERTGRRRSAAPKPLSQSEGRRQRLVERGPQMLKHSRNVATVLHPRRQAASATLVMRPAMQTAAAMQEATLLLIWDMRYSLNFGIAWPG